MASWSLCGRHAGPGKPPTPIFINLDNVLSVERQGDLTTVVMVGGEKVYIDTMPENPRTGAIEDDIVVRGFRAVCCNRIMWGVEGFEEIHHHFIIFKRWA
jgi:hypothetical protein